jgi:hypothetical protein
MSQIKNLVIEYHNNPVAQKFNILEFEQSLGAKDLREAGGQYLTDEEFNKLILKKL